MKFSFFLSFLAAFLLPSAASGEKILQSLSLNSCQEQSEFSASLFNVVVTSDGKVSANVSAVVSVQGKVVFDVALRVYGYEYLRQTLDPCDNNLQGLCPMNPGKINMEFNLDIGDALKQVPSIAYSIPDLDATVRALVNLTDTKETVACVEADFSNGKTVDLLGVKWVTAIIIGLGFISAAVVSGWGHALTAAHLTANTLSLVGYFQAQAYLGMTGVDMPPIVQRWTQNFQWSMGIINVDWMQRLCTWYQRATGGEAMNLLDELSGVSVQVSKRSTELVDAVSSGFSNIAKRTNIKNDDGSYVVFGIQRVAFRAKIETTNLFLTGLIIYCAAMFLIAASVAAFKAGCELAAKKNWMRNERFLDFRRQWLTQIKGILFRINLIGLPPITVLCLWEFGQADSPALVVLAVFFLFGTLLTLCWAAFKIVSIARLSQSAHQNPAYMLFSDPNMLNKWGFLYVQYRSSAYFFVIPFMVYILIKSLVIAFGQHKGVGQAIAIIIVEAVALIAYSVYRPFMDKSTNSFNISVASLNFVNAVFLLVFTNVFDLPGIVVGVVGVVLFVVNAVFSLVLLIMIIVSSVLIWWRSFGKPQARTQQMDLFPGGAGDDKTGYKNLLDDEEDKFDNRRESLKYTEKAAESGTAGHELEILKSEPKVAVSPAMPLFPADVQSQSRNASPMPSPRPHPGNDWPAPLSPSVHNPHSEQFRAQHNASPWQRGAGYDH
ncbi:transient receptor potential Ion channel [Colletotrichum plurivorum]|uniref:Transient receptor potential Ion channel n=1 Tax=Colletotrichum plurivorum TaxID=2175906 RepID=A0A8H6N6U8_9PEZI|nr:transient receptor potential Ion channel [Colletotrichum plurivorum]